MGTATSRLGRAALAVVAIALGAAGCGSTSSASSTGQPGASTPTSVAPTAPPVPAGFSWLRPAPVPPGWRPVHGDIGTATVALQDRRDHFLGYLNLTPRQGHETAADWASFRVAHNADEGDRQIVTLAVGRGLRFRTGVGTCVRDAYTTSTGNRYVELACLVAGARTSSVIVGAAPPQTWPRYSALLERAISTFTT